MAAIRILEAGEAGGEVAAAEEGLDGGDGIGVERAEGFPVKFFVEGEEGVPAVADDLPEGRGAGAAGLVNRRHKECSYKHFLCGAKSRVMDLIWRRSGV